MAKKKTKSKRPNDTKAARKKGSFVAALRVSGSVTKAAEAAKLDRRLAYRWRDGDAAFAADWDEALEAATEALESEARRRAFEGVVRFKFDSKGNPLLDPRTGEPYVEYEYSDTLLIFLLKGLKPDKYRERVKVEHAGEVKHTLTLADCVAELQKEGVPEEQWDRVVREYHAANRN